MGRVVARSLREELIRMVCEHMPINYMVDEQNKDLQLLLRIYYVIKLRQCVILYHESNSNH